MGDALTWVRSIREFFQRFWFILKAERAGRPYWQYTVTCDRMGLCFVWETIDHRKLSETAIAWTEVVRVTALELPAGTIDFVCLEFERADGSAVRVQDDVDGFYDLIDILPDYLAECVPSKTWWPVVSPPFERKRMVIFERGEGTGLVEAG